MKTLIPIFVLGLTLNTQSNQSDLLTSAEEVLSAVSRIRQLELKVPVEKGVRSRDEIREFLVERVKKEYPEEEIKAEETLLKMLGLIPDDMDLYRFMLDLLVEQVAGYYDPYANTFYIADWIPVEIQKPVMAHELMHALQDQHFDLEQFLDRIEGNDDMTLARNALIEGEGLAIMLEFTLEPLGQRFIDLPDIVQLNRSQLPMMEAQFPIFASAPKYLQESLLFPYSFGADFIQSFLRHNEWAAIDQLYNDLPVSTEQIMHPEKYYQDRDLPTKESAEELQESLEGDWKVILENVLGEYGILLMLNRYLDDEEAKEASSGWDGDEVRVVSDGIGNNSLLISTTWDSEEDARQFFSAYRRLLEKKYESFGTENGTSRSTEVQFNFEEGRASLVRKGIRVSVVETERGIQ